MFAIYHYIWFTQKNVVITMIGLHAYHHLPISFTFFITVCATLAQSAQSDQPRVRTSSSISTRGFPTKSYCPPSLVIVQTYIQKAQLQRIDQHRSPPHITLRPVCSQGDIAAVASFGSRSSCLRAPASLPEVSRHGAPPF